MKSEFLLGVVGFLIVFLALVGGMIIAGVCHRLLTPHLDFCYMIWLWLWLIPLWWICTVTLVSDRIQHPVATYVGFLPLFLAMHAVISQFGPGNPWLLPAMIAACVFYSVISTGVDKVCKSFLPKRL